MVERERWVGVVVGDEVVYSRTDVEKSERLSRRWASRVEEVRKVP